MRKVGLVGYCCDTGLGNATADFYRHLPFNRWLVVPHPVRGVDMDRVDRRCTVGLAGHPRFALQRWLGQLSCVFSIETEYFRGLWRMARGEGVTTVVMVNAERFRPDDPQLEWVDVFIAPTAQCQDYLVQSGFASRTVFVPHVVDVDRFAFQRRQSARVFTHSRGLGTRDRKGTTAILAAATRCPQIQFLVHTQSSLIGPIPSNVRILGPHVDPVDQYTLGDVALQPSRWEGVGLHVLESMSCGLPTIVPDAAPMNEHVLNPGLRVPADPETVMIAGKPWTGWRIDVDRFVALIQFLHGKPVSRLSEEARHQMESRSWPRLTNAYERILGMAN